MTRSSRWLDLGLVLMAAALATGWSATHRPVPASPSPGPISAPFAQTTLNQVCPGMSREQVLERLGPATCQGPLKVVDGLGSYMEYGSPSLTWNGSPTLTFHPDGRVLAVVGSELRLAGATAPVRMGEPAVRGMVGSDGAARAQLVDTGVLTITAARSGVISRMVLSER